MVECTITSAALANLSTCSDADEPWWQRYVVAGISANHHAAGRCIDAKGHVARNVGRANGTDFYVARDHTICGSSFGSKVIVLINSAGPPAVRSLISEWRCATSPD